MKHHLISIAATLLSCLAPACQPSHFSHEKSGIDLRLLSASGGAVELRPDGVLEFRGHENDVSLYVPVAPLDLDSSTQRVRLPAGSYSVTYHPVRLDDSFRSLRYRAPGRVVSQNPFVVSVSEGSFVPIDVRILDGTTPPSVREPRRSVAIR